MSSRPVRRAVAQPITQTSSMSASVTNRLVARPDRVFSHSFAWFWKVSTMPLRTSRFSAGVAANSGWVDRSVSTDAAGGGAGGLGGTYNAG
jgi:hypothetical protein